MLVCSMPTLISVRERLNQIYYHGWIADTRPGGAGVLPTDPFMREMRLFAVPSTDPQRTNMNFFTRVPEGMSVNVKKIGVFASFTNPNHLPLAMEGRYNLFVNQEVVPVDKKEPCIKARRPDNTLLLTKTIDEAVIGPESTFFMRVRSSGKLYREMKKIERGVYPDTYAEITGILDTISTREVN